MGRRSWIALVLVTVSAATLCHASALEGEGERYVIDFTTGNPAPVVEQKPVETHKPQPVVREAPKPAPVRPAAPAPKPVTPPERTYTEAELKEMLRIFEESLQPMAPHEGPMPPSHFLNFSPDFSKISGTGEVMQEPEKKHGEVSEVKMEHPVAVALLVTIVILLAIILHRQKPS